MAVTTSLSDQGWLPPKPAAEHEAIVSDAIELVRALAEPLHVGTIVRRRIDDFHAFPPRASR